MKPILLSKKFPQVIYAYAILLDNKIESWHVSFKNRNSAYEFSGYWKNDRLKDYKLKKVCWICRNSEECTKVFEILAPRWFKSWKHADDYRLVKAY